MRLAVDLNLVDIVLGNDGPISLEELAQKSKADPDLLRTSKHAHSTSHLDLLARSSTSTEFNTYQSASSACSSP
jgi:hypothetical protein